MKNYNENDKKAIIWTFVIFIIWLILSVIILIASFNGGDEIENEFVATETELIEKEKEFITTETEFVSVEIKVLECDTEKEIFNYTKEEAYALCKAVWGEARGCSLTEQAAVVWCILNRVDDERFPNDIISVLTQENQFSGYSSSFPIDDSILELVEDVLNRWSNGDDVGRVLPKEYCWFRGNGTENIFRDAYSGNYNIWNWTLESPYKDG